MSWDLFCKALLKECAQDFVTYFAPGAHFVGMRECQLQTRLDGPFDPREMRADIAIEAERTGLPFLLNVEWQSSRDDEMAERLLGYSYEITRLHKQVVLSTVVYTCPIGELPRAPLVRAIPGEGVPGGSPALWFNFVCLDVCNKEVATLRALDLDAFSVLMLLCKDGGTSAILEEVLARLLEHQRKEAISVALFFAGKVLTSEEDRKFLERKYTMVQDLLKDNWTYQRMLEDGRAEGLVKGRAEGLVEGRAEGLVEGRVEGRAEGLVEGRAKEAQKSIELFVEKRFPSLLDRVKAQIEQINDPETLQAIMSALFAANTPAEIEAAVYVRQ